MRRQVSKDFLAFWFNYYGKDAYDCNEYKAFLDIVDKVTPEKFFNSIVVNFFVNNSVDPTFYLFMIRQESLEEFLRCSAGVESDIKSDMNTRKNFIKAWVNIYDAIEKDYLESRGDC